MPTTCLVCQKTRSPNVSMHRFPPKSTPAKRLQWLTAFKLKEHDVLDHHRVCSRHFPNGDIAQPPSLSLGKRFSSPKKPFTSRGMRAAKRRKICVPLPVSSVRKSPSLSREVTPSTPETSSPLTTTPTDPVTTTLFPPPTLLSPPTQVSTSDQFSPPTLFSVPQFSSPTQSEYSDGDSSVNVSSIPSSADRHETEVIINTALVARIDALQVENKTLKDALSNQKSRYFRLQDIADNNKLVRFYTGFESYDLLIAFYEFLGDAVNNLRYWGTKPPKGPKKRKMKLDPLNQLFLTLIKLRLNTREVDLAVRFGLSKSVVSKYFITWVCFLYLYLKEIQWIPEVDQVKATLPHGFKDRYPNTFIILDATEIFIETPNDLHVQSSTWSNYKHHNTAKCLVGCTPNGAISFVSELYVGSVSDVELTRVSGVLDQLKGKTNISVMADRGFTIRDQLAAIKVDLNIPPFMEGRAQLPAQEVLEGRKIASLRIHVERAIGRIKNFSILKTSLPITFSRIANQIVCVCGWLVNFQTVLIAPPVTSNETDDVDDYLKSFYSSEEDSSEEDNDAELSSTTS